MLSRHTGANFKPTMTLALFISLILSLLSSTTITTAFGFSAGASSGSGYQKLSRAERVARNKAEAEAYVQLRQQGVDEVGHTAEAAALRNYQLRKKKMRGVLRKRPASLTEVLFPGVTPESYEIGEDVFFITELVQSKRTHVPFEYYDLPVCDIPSMNNFRRRHRTQRKNLGARLQGMELKPSPYTLQVKRDMPCTALCTRQLTGKQVRWLRKMVLRQYRVHMTFDSLPVLMRSSELNYAVRGYPVGFKAPPSYTGLSYDEYYLYNHLKFTITYQEAGDSSGGIYITGFDVHPVSIIHDPANTAATCSAEESPVNDPQTYLALRVGPSGEDLTVTYSYEVEWVESELPWADRWDVYLIGSPDDDIHFFAIVNSLMIVVFLTGAIATIMIRTLRKDISAYNEVSMLDDGAEETGWKLVHGDVFRPPTFSPMALSVLTGTGAQIGAAFFISMVAAILKLLNPVKKGHTLTAMVVLYVLCGSVAGYVSARIYKYCDAKYWKINMIATATAIPGVLVAIFTVLNIFLSFAGAATAVSFLTLVSLFLLWVCVSTPLVFVGAFIGMRMPKIEVPCKTNQIARMIPDTPWYTTPPFSFALGGILPFGSVCIELFFIMSALWLHQIYYVMGFLLAVLLILAATCAQVSIVMGYLQLCAEDHRWWWKSFGNCASAGGYLLLYSLWFLSSRLELVGILPVVVYLTYMSMISLLFGIFCGSIGFLCAFWFNRSIYGALKVD